MTVEENASFNIEAAPESLVELIKDGLDELSEDFSVAASAQISYIEDQDDPFTGVTTPRGEKDVLQLAVGAANNAFYDGYTRRKQPDTIAASAIYVSLEYCRLTPERKDVAEVLGVSPNSISRHNSAMRDYLVSALNSMD